MFTMEVRCQPIDLLTTKSRDRSFDVDTHAASTSNEEVLPAREFPTDDNARTTFRQRFREKFEGDPSKSRLYKDISQGFTPAGIEYYLPLFFESTATLADYLPAGTLVCLHQDVAKAISQLWQETHSRYTAARRPVALAPPPLFVRETSFSQLKPFARIETAYAATQGHRTPLP